MMTMWWWWWWLLLLLLLLLLSLLYAVMWLQGKAGRSKAVSSSIYRKLSGVSETADAVRSGSMSAALGRTDAGELPPSTNDRLKHVQTLWSSGEPSVYRRHWEITGVISSNVLCTVLWDVFTWQGIISIIGDRRQTYILIVWSRPDINVTPLAQN